MRPLWRSLTARSLRVILPIVAVVAYLASFGAAWAANVVYVWPPLGDSYHNVYPSGPWGCFPTQTWSHSVALHVFDGGFSGAGLYIYYFDNHSGISSTNPVYWSRLYISDRRNSGNDLTVLAPPVTLFGNDWTVWANRWFGYTSNFNDGVYSQTIFAATTTGSCSGLSYVVFRH